MSEESKKKNNTAKLVKQRMTQHSELAQSIARHLQGEGMLQIPEHKRGWGIAAFKVEMAAEQIDRVLHAYQNTEAEIEIMEDGTRYITIGGERCRIV